MGELRNAFGTLYMHNWIHYIENQTKGQNDKKFRGVISVDESLLHHYGQDFEQTRKLWDYVIK